MLQGLQRVQELFGAPSPTACICCHFNIAIYDRATALATAKSGAVISLGSEQTTPVLPPQVVLAMLPEGGPAGAAVGVMVVGVLPEVVPVDGVRVAVVPEEPVRLKNPADARTHSTTGTDQEFPCLCNVLLLLRPFLASRARYRFPASSS